MNNILILVDTRQKSDKYITDYFDKNSILWIRTCLPSADYMAIKYNNGFIKDYSVLIDTKKDVEEIVGNLCKTSEHERIKAEIQRAKDLGCKKFIFLICDNKIKNINDLVVWKSRRTKVKGETLLKIIVTMQKKYDIKFLFTSKENAGELIYKLLSQ